MEYYLEEKASDEKTWKALKKTQVVIESPKEVASCLGSKLINIQINVGDDDGNEPGAYNNGIAEIMLEFENGKEWRFYIDTYDHKLHLYSD